MALTFTIAGIDKTSLVQVDSLSITDELNSRNTCTFSLLDTIGAYRPAIGAAVAIADGATKYFTGTIDRIVELQLMGTSTLAYSVECVDYNQVCDRHLVAAVYENQTLKQIVEDIVTDCLTGESITTTNVETGPTITKAVFNYKYVNEVFNELAELTGYSWYIDYDKDLHFFARETNVAPFSLTDDSRNYRDVQVTKTREQYRNKQYVRAGQDITDQQTAEKPTPKPDGVTKTFVLKYPVAQVPTVEVNSVAQTVGIRDVDSGKQWYWSKGDNTITQDNSEAVLTDTDVLEVTYYGLFPILIQTQLDQEIATRVTAEGGSGIYEAIDEDGNIDKQDLAIDKAAGLLRKYGSIPQIVEFETDADGLAAGQLLTINITAHNLNGQYLIDSVAAQDKSGIFLRYRVRALSGESLGGWVEFFRKLAAAGKTYVIRENEVLILVRNLTDQVICGDDFTASSATPESRVGYAMVGFSEVGA